MNILISAYACRPGEGSEPGVGWNLVRELAQYHCIWVLTRQNNRPAIEAELTTQPLPGLQFIYCEPPRWVQWLNQNQRVVYFHYYLWQVQAYLTARRLHQEIGFDVVHHVTYVRYASPSFLSRLPVPFIWGPVGGGESAPKPFRRDFSWRGKVYERIRHLASTVGEYDPFVRLTARRSVLARGATADTAKRLRALGAAHVQVESQLGLSTEEMAQLHQLAQRPRRSVIFISIGRLLHWKGFHLGLQAFAQAQFQLPEDAQYWIVGDGPERQRLQRLAKRLGIGSRVRFWRQLSRADTLTKLGECLALIHPSLHESGGLVCLEAMAAGCPVICLNLGGPALLVTEETGLKIPALTPEQATRDLAAAMTRLAEDTQLWRRLSRGGPQRVKQAYSWEIKGRRLAQLYENITGQEPTLAKAGHDEQS